MTEKIIRISITQASHLFGVSGKTIRQAIKNQEIKYIVVRGRYKLNFSSVLEWSQKSTRRKNQFYTQGLGQYSDLWKIRNRKYSPSQELVEKESES